MSCRLLLSTLVVAVLICASATHSTNADEQQVERGKYLVSVIPGTDCHTPGALLGKPDMKRYLGGSEVGLALPDLGIFYGSNLTPDTEIRLGKVAGPFAPNQKPVSFVMTTIPAAAYWALPRDPPGK